VGGNVCLTALRVDTPDLNISWAIMRSKAVIFGLAAAVLANAQAFNSRWNNPILPGVSSDD
jgi:hypothetical protein